MSDAPMFDGQPLSKREVEIARVAFSLGVRDARASRVALQWTDRAIRCRAARFYPLTPDRQSAETLADFLAHPTEEVEA